MTLLWGQSYFLTPWQGKYIQLRFDVYIRCVVVTLWQCIARSSSQRPVATPLLEQRLDLRRRLDVPVHQVPPVVVCHTVEHIPATCKPAAEAPFCARKLVKKAAYAVPRHCVRISSDGSARGSAISDCTSSCHPGHAGTCWLQVLQHESAI